MDECIFCKVAKRELPAEILYEDEEVVAFRDINPRAPVHILIIPKIHISTFFDIKDEHISLLGHLYMVIKRLAVDEGLEERGFRVVLNCKKDAGQEIFHIHLHLLGGRSFGWPPG